MWSETGVTSEIRTPDIPMPWLNVVCVMERVAYVADTVSHQIVAVKLAAQA